MQCASLTRASCGREGQQQTRGGKGDGWKLTTHDCNTRARLNHSSYTFFLGLTFGVFGIVFGLADRGEAPLRKSPLDL